MRKADPERQCQNCARPIQRRRYSTGLLENRNRFISRRFCDRACMAAAMTQTEVTKGAYLWRARKHRKPSCESCGTTASLQVHHRDGNWKNNNPQNLRTLCASCHTKLHWRLDAKARERRWVKATHLDYLLSICADLSAHLPASDASRLAAAMAPLQPKRRAA